MNGTIRELHPGSGGLARVLCLVSLAGALGNGRIGIVWVWCCESSQKISRTFLRHGNFSLLESKDLQDKLGRCFLRRTKDLIADQMPKKGKTVFRKVLVVYLLFHLLYQNGCCMVLFDLQERSILTYRFFFSFYDHLSSQSEPTT